MRNNHPNDSSEPDDSGGSSSDASEEIEHKHQYRRHAENDDDDMKLDDGVMKELMGGDTNNNDDNSNNNSSDDMSEDGDDALQYNYNYSPTDTDGLLKLLDHNEPLSTTQLERIQTIENAATKVFDVIQKYGKAPLPLSLDPNDASNNKRGWEIDEESAWANTSCAMEEIVTAREEMIMAWEGDENGDAVEERDGLQLQDKEDPWWKSIISNESTNKNDAGKARNDGVDTNKESGGEKPLTKEEQDEFQQVHMEWATNAFAEELEALRKGQLLETTTLASTKRQKKSSNGAAAASTEKESPTAVELDPNQYSFVVASKGKTKDANAIAKEAAMAAEEIDVQVLADMLQSGSNFLSNSEKKMLLRARQRGMATSTMGGANDAANHSGCTLHELRKRELGFLVE